MAERRDWFVKGRVWWRVGREESRRGMCNGLEELSLVARRQDDMVVRRVDAMIVRCEAPAPPQCPGDTVDLVKKTRFQELQGGRRYINEIYGRR